MKRISYHVDCKKELLQEKLKKNSKHIDKLLAEIIFKRKEKTCYEVASSKRIDISKM